MAEQEEDMLIEWDVSAEGIFLDTGGSLGTCVVKSMAETPVGSTMARNALAEIFRPATSGLH